MIQEDLDRLDMFCERAKKKGLLHRPVTCKTTMGTQLAMVLRGLMLDEHGDVCAVVARNADDPRCHLVHPSRVLELTQED